MNQEMQNQIAWASHLAVNHWLGHARDIIQDVRSKLPVPDALCEELLQLVEQRIQHNLLNLSLNHQPITQLEQGRILSTLHLTKQTDPLLKKLAFKQGVFYIDVETSSQCNRKCVYCPNATNDRLSFNKFIEKSVFERMVNDLAEIDYDQFLHFVGYNEPLMHRESILEHITYARKNLSQAKIKVFTNGDYLKADYLDALDAAGVNEICISIHLAAGETYNDEDIVRRIHMMAKKLNTNAVITNYQKDQGVTARMTHPRMHIEMYQRDYMAEGHNRGGLLENVGKNIQSRHAGCTLPTTQFILGYTGTVIPCCVLVGDDERHAKYLTGHMTAETSIFDIYNDDNALAWRRGLLNLEPKRGPCSTCSAQVDSKQHNAPVLYNKIQEIMRRIESTAA